MEDTWTRLRKNVLELKNGVLNLNRMFEPFAEEDEEPTGSAKERSRLVSSAIRRMQPDPAADENGFDGMIFDILDAWFKGVSVQEIDWQVIRVGQLGDITAPRSTYWVHPVCYAWSMEGRLGLRSDAAGRLSPGNISGPSYQPLPSSVMPFPDDKFLISVCKTKSGTALGGALLRPLAWWWCASNFSADWLLNLAQVFGLPFRWANYDPNVPQETVDTICSMLQNMGSAGWAAFPAGTTLELKADGMKSGSDTPQGDILDRADKQCDLLVLGQTLTSDTGGGGKGGGSLALGKVHEGVKGEIVQAAANFAESVIENQLIPSILRLNYGDDDERPSIRLESEEESDLAADSQVIKTLADAGAGEIVGLDWLGKKFGIPKPGKGEETLKKEKPEAGNLKPETGKPGVSDGSDGSDESDKAEPVLARIASIEDDGEFSEVLLGYCRALKCGGGNPNHDHANGRFASADTGGGGGGGGDYDSNAAVRQGMLAVEKSLSSHQDVMDAMRLPEGTVDFRWGNDGEGVKHVLKRAEDRLARRDRVRPGRHEHDVARGGQRGGEGREGDRAGDACRGTGAGGPAGSAGGEGEASVFRFQPRGRPGVVLADGVLLEGRPGTRHLLPGRVERERPHGG